MYKTICSVYKSLLKTRDLPLNKNDELKLRVPYKKCHCVSELKADESLIPLSHGAPSSRVI